jgi:alpha-1,2-mannosyltransferase
VSCISYRPEKDHTAQLHSFRELLKAHPEYGNPDNSGVKLVLVGGSRNAGDAARVDGLQLLAKDLGIEVSKSPPCARFSPEVECHPGRRITSNLW